MSFSVWLARRVWLAQRTALRGQMSFATDFPQSTYTAGVELSSLVLLGSFVLGLLLGSFLNVCISRLPVGESVIGGRSMCRSCGKTVRWYDNIPLLSWVILRAQCRDCKAAISWRYPAVELATALWFLRSGSILWRDWNFTCDFCNQYQIQTNRVILDLAVLAAGYLLIGLIVMDWQTHTLPDSFTISGIILGFALTCVHAMYLAPGEGEIHLHRQVKLNSAGAGRSTGDLFITGPEAVVLGRVVAIAGAMLLLLIFHWSYKALRKREGMGMGDVKLLGMIAAFFGWWPAVLALFVGTITATVYAVIQMARGRADRLTELPYGTFLAIGGLITAMAGPLLIGWYAGLLR